MRATTQIPRDAKEAEHTNGGEDALHEVGEEWREERDRQVKSLQSGIDGQRGSNHSSFAPAVSPGPFGEVRRKIASGETTSRSLERLLAALRFSGRITLTFHQGKLTKSVLEESYFRGSTLG